MFSNVFFSFLNCYLKATGNEMFYKVKDLYIRQIITLKFISLFFTLYFVQKNPREWTHLGPFTMVKQLYYTISGTVIQRI